MRTALLQVGNGGTAGSLGAGAVTDDGSLVFDLSTTSTTQNNSITGPGGLTQDGSGDLILAGSDGITGPITANNGSLTLESTALSASSIDIAAAPPS